MTGECNHRARRPEYQATGRGARIRGVGASAGPSMSPQRIQLRRTRGWRKPPGAVVVARPTRWGNPFPVAEHGRAEAVGLYSEWLATQPGLIAAARAQLGGRDLACWCPLDEECRADVLLAVANSARPA